MKVNLNNGKLVINDQEVLTVLFKNGSVLHFPIPDTNEILVEGSGGSNSTTIRGNGNIAITGKNIISGNVSCNGDFRLGDG